MFDGSLTNLEGEIWKDCSKYKGILQVSNLGRVKRLHRIVHRTLRDLEFEEKILKPCFLGSVKYCYVNIRLDNGSHKYERVSTLVADAFLPNPDPKNLRRIINSDGNISNNRAENLEWVA